MSDREPKIIDFRPRDKLIIPFSTDFNGAAAREINLLEIPFLRLIKSNQPKVIPIRPDVKVGQEEVFEMNKDHVAPKAGERAIKIQSEGAKTMDDEMEKYQRTGIFTPATARAIGNTFIRVRAIGEGSGIPNLSQSAWVPEVQDSAQACALLKKMGDIIAPKDAHVVEYGRLVMYVWDVDQLDYQQLSSQMAAAPKVIISEHSPENETLELNRLQDRRSAEFKRKEAIFKGILNGSVDPAIPAVPDKKEDPEDSLLIWGSKRVGSKVYAINPDLDLQDEEELQITDLWTKGLLAHERDLTLSAPKGKIRLIMVLANDAYVRRCCITVTNFDEKDTAISTGKVIDFKEALDIRNNSFSKSDEIKISVKSGGGYEDNICHVCGQEKNSKGECHCPEKSKAA